MRDKKVVVIGSHVSPSTHISLTKHDVTEILYEGNYGNPVYGEILKEDENYIHFKDFFSGDTIRIGHRKVKDIRSARIVEDVRDITAWKYYNKPKGPKVVETRYILVGINDKIMLGEKNTTNKVIYTSEEVG